MRSSRVLPFLASTALAVAMLLPLAPAAAGAEQSRIGPSWGRGATEVVAHRGASADAPENTLAAVDESFRQRADTIEVDVQRSADGHLVLMHDRTLLRTTNVAEVFPARATAPVGSFTLAELRRLDAGSWFSPEFAGERIPTLRELILRTNVRAGLLLEVKDPALYPGIEEQIARDLARVPGYLPVALATRKLTVQSFDVESMRRFDRIAPRVPVGQLYGARPTAAQLDDAATYAEQLTTNFRRMDAELAGEIRQRRMSPGVYTVNEPADMRRMIEVGVDRIITDRPNVLRGVLRG